MQNRLDEADCVWEIYKNLYDLLKDVDDKARQKEEERITKGIECFAAYISQADSTHHYNRTYIPKFTEEFWIFLNAFWKKYAVVKSLFFIVEDKKNVVLTVDRYWQIKTKTDWSGEYKVCLNDTKQVCKDEMLIECSILNKTRRYVYHDQIPLKDIEDNQYAHAIEKVKDFLKSHSSEDMEGDDE